MSHYVLVDSTGCNPGWLWEISGNGLLQKSYLFGTCHGEGHNFTDTLSMKEQVKSLYSIVNYVINNDSLNSYFQAFANVFLKNDTCMMWK